MLDSLEHDDNAGQSGDLQWLAQDAFDDVLPVFFAGLSDAIECDLLVISVEAKKHARQDLYVKTRIAELEVVLTEEAEFNNECEGEPMKFQAQPRIEVVKCLCRQLIAIEFHKDLTLITE